MTPSPSPNRQEADASATSGQETNVSNDNTALAAQQAAGLRALADMIEANPDLAPLANAYLPSMDVFYAWTKDDVARIARAGLAHGAKVEKAAFNNTFGLTLRWGPVGASTLGDRSNVCERVVTVETVEEEVPDPEALAAVPTVKQIRQVENVSWKCGPWMADAKTAA